MKISIIQVVAKLLLALLISIPENLANSVETTNVDLLLPLSLPKGEIIGMTNYTRDSRPYYSFLGIPYGKSKRFQESEPADPWEGIRDGTKFGEDCLQFNNYLNDVVGSEDCLFLNVYTPQLPSSENPVALPVMVYIHGGSLIGGRGTDYGGKYLMDEDVVLVTINYRLGPFGWVDTSYGANLGLKDQILSLEWVRDNIRSFGGDPNTVTIVGESAGSSSVGLHILSPLSKGLFHRAISESGVPINDVIDLVREFRKLGAMMDCPTSNRTALTECLAAMDARALLLRLHIPILPGFQVEDIPKFAPTVDKDSAGRVSLPDTPLNLLLSGDFARVPWIVGANSHEMLPIYIDLALSEPFRDYINQNWNEVIPDLLGYKGYNCRASSDIREFYLNNQPIGSPETMQNFINGGNDRVFLHPSKINAQLHSNFAPTYLYHFSLRGPATFDPRWHFYNFSMDGLAPPSHSDELQYLFHAEIFYPEISHGSRFEQFSDWFVKLWVSFAKDGKPSSDWNPVNSNNVNVDWYQIDTVSRMVPESAILGDRMNFWEGLFPIKSNSSLN